ncbi:MAG TPA: hypothetical protein VF062_26765 [Candidatus Limnocylindrales bacterium]
MTELVIHDRGAGLLFNLSSGWNLRNDVDMVEPFTCFATRSELPVDPHDPLAAARADAEEERLWREAMAPDWEPSDDDDEDPQKPAEGTSVTFGKLDDPADGEGAAFGVFEGVPTEQDLLEAAGTLSHTYGAMFGFYPDGQIRSETRSHRLFELDGRPSAEITHTVAAGRDGRNTGYMRTIVVHLADGRTSFALGIASPGSDRSLVDAVIDSVKPLP